MFLMDEVDDEPAAAHGQKVQLQVEEQKNMHRTWDDVGGQDSGVIVIFVAMLVVVGAVIGGAVRHREDEANSWVEASVIKKKKTDVAPSQMTARSSFNRAEDQDWSFEEEEGSEDKSSNDNLAGANEEGHQDSDKDELDSMESADRDAVLASEAPVICPHAERQPQTLFNDDDDDILEATSTSHISTSALHRHSSQARSISSPSEHLDINLPAVTDDYDMLIEDQNRNEQESDLEDHIRASQQTTRREYRTQGPQSNQPLVTYQKVSNAARYECKLIRYFSRSEKTETSTSICDRLAQLCHPTNGAQSPRNQLIKRTLRTSSNTSAEGHQEGEDKRESEAQALYKKVPPHQSQHLFTSSIRELPDEHELPPGLVALATTTITAVLRDWKTGEKHAQNFEGNMFHRTYMSNIEWMAAV
ncbi:hypothetical protein E1B28_008044 [Marasmius oreades]|uniref:DUF6532 domain-containing protein n=1 Tax=Marasmius oreades TaxID=181124 RepID=A0A9P7S3E3_9AGAR|nr:uncharacterized protein E1B28_008044 [Marasmius oreades]KAG7094448.1 hypothetical protein E1B28_008044 [Marasmius oreades]